MTKLRLLTYRQLKKVVEKAGFKWQRCQGSHNAFKNSQGHVIVIPDHGAQVIVRPLLRKIVRNLGINIEEYNRIIDEL